MKKLLNYVLILFIVSLTFTACLSSEKDDDKDDVSAPSIPTTGEELDKLAEQKLMELKSYTSTQTTRANITVSDIDFGVEATTTQIVSGNGTEDFSTITTMSSSTSYKDTYGKEITDTDDYTEGFQDGYMFYISYLHGSAFLKSKITANDYKAFTYNHKTALLNPYADENPGSSTIEQLEDGWKATLYNFKPEFVRHYFRMAVGGDIEFDTLVDDLSVTITTDKDFVYKSIVYEFLFTTPEGAKDTVNSLSMVAEFSGINSTPASKHNIDNCTEVEDLRDYYILKNAIDRMKLAESGFCEMSYEYSDTYIYTEDVLQTYQIEFKRNNQLTYTQSIFQDTTKILQSYDSGKIETTYTIDGVPEAEKTSESTDTVQLSGLLSMFDYAEFEIEFCSQPKKLDNSENTYVTELDESEAFKAKIGDVVITSIKLTVTINNNNVERYQTIIEGYYPYPYNDRKFTIKTDASFNWGE